MKNVIYSVAFLLACLVVGQYVGTAIGAAVPTQLSAAGAANVSAFSNCSFQGAVAKTVAVTAATATSSAATNSGGAQLICDVAVHYKQGLPGVTGITGGTTDTLLPANTAKILTVDRSYFGIIGTTGTCFITECQ